MTEDLEKRLRGALRPIDPGEEFTQRVMREVAPRRGAWVSVALAASVAVAVIGIGVYGWQQQQKAEGLAARAQVLEALRVTTDKLELASRLLNAPSQRVPD